MKIEIKGSATLKKKLQQIGQQTQTRLEKATTAAAEVVRAHANQQAPGPHIVQETVETVPGYVEVHVGPDKDHWYYMFAELGTTPHVIRPKRGQFLVFTGPAGNVVRVRQVQHPGHAARPFLRPAVTKQKDKAVAAFAKTLNDLYD